jgi:Xaa-Pro aminopeptidase
MGLLRGDKRELIEQGAYKAFYMHRTSHWLGMDVHDVGRYHHAGQPRPLEPGFVLTIEPGLYIPVHANVDERFRGIGVRIEDDVLVTPSGYENLTQDIPKTVAELEAHLAQR